LVELVDGSGNSLLNYSTRSSNVVELIIFGIRATEWSAGRGLDQHYERTLCEAQIFTDNLVFLFSLISRIGLIFPTRRFDNTARVEFFSRVSGSPGGFALDTSVLMGEVLS
jgi:hypothetical protein